MLKTTVAIAATILLAACGGGTTPTANDAAEATANDATVNYQAAVLDLNDQQRNAVMIRAIRDANIQCQGVTESERIEGEGLTYRARCDGGADHVVSIAADGNARVVSAAMRP